MLVIERTCCYFNAHSLADQLNRYITDAAVENKPCYGRIKASCAIRPDTTRFQCASLIEELGGCKADAVLERYRVKFKLYPAPFSSLLARNSPAFL